MAESDEHFLRCVLQALERLRDASQNRGHPMLASMIDLAKAEAEDDLRTHALTLERFSEFGKRASPAGTTVPGDLDTVEVPFACRPAP